MNIDLSLNLEDRSVKTELKNWMIIVDDEPSILTSMMAFFEDQGYHVLTSASCEDAIRILEKHNVKVGIFDINISGKNGSELIEQAHELQPHMKFIIHTGSIDFLLSPRMIALGICEENVFFKPLERLELLTEGVRNLLENEA